MDCLGPLLYPAMQPASTGAALVDLYLFRYNFFAHTGQLACPYSGDCQAEHLDIDF